jgi:hypothetical protein
MDLETFKTARQTGWKIDVHIGRHLGRQAGYSRRAGIFINRHTGYRLTHWQDGRQPNISRLTGRQTRVSVDRQTGGHFLTCKASLATSKNKVMISPGNPYCTGRLSTVDLLVLTC